MVKKDRLSGRARLLPSISSHTQKMIMIMIIAVTAAMSLLLLKMARRRGKIHDDTNVADELTAFAVFAAVSQAAHAAALMLLLLLMMMLLLLLGVSTSGLIT